MNRCAGRRCTGLDIHTIKTHLPGHTLLRPRQTSSNLVLPAWPRNNSNRICAAQATEPSKQSEVYERQPIKEATLEADAQQQCDREEKMQQFLKYLPKGTTPEEVDWSLLGVDIDSPVTPLRRSREPRMGDRQELLAGKTTDATFSIQLVQWYPGHIAKAERQLKEQLSKVDVVLEVRDARIPVSTWHPQVSKWVGAKPKLLLMNRIDMVSSQDRQQWRELFQRERISVFWTDGKLGTGIGGVRKAVLQVAEVVNAKRAKRGLQPRPVRACVIGFPNIGKSALINRLLNRRVVDSAPVPGVTRVLRWVRLGGEVDLLDAPGVIPASFTDQLAAQRLAMCNDIGGAAYEDSLIAAALIIRIKNLPCSKRVLARISLRYKLDPMKYETAEDFVAALAERLFQGDRDRAGARILQDFRTGALGNFALECPEDWLAKQDQGYAL